MAVQTMYKERHVVSLIIKGCSPNGMIMYPEMLMLVLTKNGLWSIPIFSRNTEMGKIDPFHVITNSMWKEYGVKIPSFKFLFTSTIMDSARNSKAYIDYYDVRIDGCAKTKSQKYMQTAFKHINFIRSKINHTTVALDRYLLWCDEKEKKEKALNAHIKKVMNHMDRANVENLTGAHSMFSFVDPMTTTSDIMTVKNISVIKNNSSIISKHFQF